MAGTGRAVTVVWKRGAAVHMRREPIEVRRDRKHTDRGGRTGVRVLWIDRYMENDTRLPEETASSQSRESGSQDGARKGHQIE